MKRARGRGRVEWILEIVDACRLVDLEGERLLGALVAEEFADGRGLCATALSGLRTAVRRLARILPGAP